MSPALAPSPHTRSCASWVRMFCSFETHRRLPLGWGYALSARSAVAKSSTLRLVEFVTASPWHFGWEPILYTTLTTIWVSSSVASPASWEKPKPLRLRSEEHTSELQSQFHLVCRLLLEKKNNE